LKKLALVMNHPKYGQINSALTILIVSVFPVPLTNYDTVKSGTVDKMVGIFTKRIWQPYLGQGHVSDLLTC